MKAIACIRGGSYFESEQEIPLLLSLRHFMAASLRLVLLCRQQTILLPAQTVTRRPINGFSGATEPNPPRPLNYKASQITRVCRRIVSSVSERPEATELLVAASVVGG